MRATPGENVLDVGHGRGEIALQLAERGVLVLAQPARVWVSSRSWAGYDIQPFGAPRQIVRALGLLSEMREVSWLHGHGSKVGCALHV